MLQRKNILFIILILFTAFLIPGCQNNVNKNHFDVVIYGGTSAGIAAGIQLSRMGKSVLVIEPSNRIGGLTTGGLGQTDIGNKHAIGGISREFYQNIKKYYDNPDNWKWQKKSEYRDGGQTRTNENENTMWTFEPSAAMKVFQDMLKNENVVIKYNQRLDRENGVKKEGKAIISIAMETGAIYFAEMFIDATYEGDLMASAGVSYTVGREPNSQYEETLNGIHPNVTGITLKGNEVIATKNHNMVDGVDPYVIKGDKESGVLPGINATGPGNTGDGDNRVQAYCFRMCLTDHPENRIPFFKPEGYNELNYELLFRNYESGANGVPWINSKMPNRKTDTNNKNGFSTDYIGENYNYPEASYEQREQIIQKHKIYQQGLMWTLANHPRIPEDIRNEVARWGTCKDEFAGEDGWQQQLYIREARRMVSDLVITQKYCEHIEVVNDGVGLAAYTMDSHNVQRYITESGQVKNEGNIEAKVEAPYAISYRAIIPKKSECNNLLVPVCLSASHIAFGSIRMEPVFMVLGQSSAIAASIAIDNKVSIHEVDYSVLKEELTKNKQRL